MENLRESSALIAAAVTAAAVSEGVATRTPVDPLQAARDAMWQPGYADGAE